MTEGSERGAITADIISDHQVAFCELNIPIVVKINKMTTLKDLYIFDANEFNSDLQSVNFSLLNYITTNLVEFFHFDIFPLRTIRVMKPQASLLTSALKDSFNKAKMKYKKNPTE